MTNPIQQNLDELARLRQQVLNHPMCFRLEEDTGSTRVLVEYPAGDFSCGGIQTSQHSKAASFKLILEKLEAEWQGSLPGDVRSFCDLTGDGA